MHEKITGGGEVENDGVGGDLMPLCFIRTDEKSTNHSWL